MISFRQICFCSFLWIGVAVVANAQVGPKGWKSSKRGNLTVYAAPSGAEFVAVGPVPGVDDPAMAVAAIRDALLGTTKLKSSRTYASNGVSSLEFEFSKGSVEFLGRGDGVRTPGGETIAAVHFGRASSEGISQRMAETQAAMIAMGSKPAVPLKQTNKIPEPEAQASAVMPTGQAATAVVFHLSYRGGVGGFTYPVYEPVYLLKDKTACRCAEQPPDAVDVNQVTQANRLGRWRDRGAHYEVTWNDGDVDELKKSVGPPTALKKDMRLTGLYRAIGGGGNVAQGGGVMAANAKDLEFFDDGSFSQSNFSYASGGGGVGYKQQGQAGVWSIRGGRLTLDYRDGTTVHTSIYYSGKRGAEKEFGALGVVWIGGKGFSRKR